MTPSGEEPTVTDERICPVCQESDKPSRLSPAHSDELPEQALRCETCYAAFLPHVGELYLVLHRPPGTRLVRVNRWLARGEAALEEEGVYNLSDLSYSPPMNNERKTNTKPANTKPSRKPSNQKTPTKKEEKMTKSKKTNEAPQPEVREKLEGSLTPADLAAEFNLTPPRFRAILRQMTADGKLPPHARRSRWLWHPDYDAEELKTIREYIAELQAPKPTELKPAPDAALDAPVPTPEELDEKKPKKGSPKKSSK